MQKIRIRISFDYGPEREVVIQEDWIEAILFLNRLEQDSDQDARRVSTIEIVGRAIKDVDAVLRKLVAEKLDEISEEPENEDDPIE